MLAHLARWGTILCCALVLALGDARGDEVPRTGGPYVPTPQNVVDEMLKLAEVRADDFVLDLGSGDGRIVLTAARRYKAHGLGFDIDEELVEASNAKAREEDIADLASFEVRDVTTAPLDRATVVTLYLLPGMMKTLQPRFFGELPPGARIVSHDFDLGDWKPDRQVNVDVAEKYGAPGAWQSTLYLWIVPARVAGGWRVTTPSRLEGLELQLEQQFQHITGVARQRGRRHAITAGRLEGNRVQFRLQRDAFEGTVDGDRMAGTAHIGSASVSWSAVRGHGRSALAQ